MREGWIQKPLGELFETVTGNTPPKSEKRLYGDFIPFVKPPELRDGLVNSASDSLSIEGAEFARVLPANSILVSCIGNLGKIGINDVPVAFNQQINAIMPCCEIAEPRFIFYQMLSPAFVADLARCASGTTVPIVNKSKFNSIPIVLPSLPDQKRIVAVLDEAFEGIRRAVANAEKNFANARELFDSYLNAVFTQRGDGWVESPIGDFADVFDGPHATPRTVDQGPIFLGISSLQDGVINLGKTRHVTDTDYQKWTRRVKPQANDIVFSYETRLGQAAIVPEGLECCLGRRMGLVRVDQGVVDPSFFVHQYISRPYRRFVASRTIRGATVDRIPLKDFPSFPFTFPTLGEQKRITSSIAKVATESNRLQAVYARKLNDLTELKQSLLQKAFTGELTAQPDKTLKEAVA